MAEDAPIALIQFRAVSRKRRASLLLTAAAIRRSADPTGTAFPKR